MRCALGLGYMESCPTTPSTPLCGEGHLMYVVGAPTTGSAHRLHRATHEDERYRESSQAGRSAVRLARDLARVTGCTRRSPYRLRWLTLGRHLRSAARHRCSGHVDHIVSLYAVLVLNVHLEQR